MTFPKAAVVQRISRIFAPFAPVAICLWDRSILLRSGRACRLLLRLELRNRGGYVVPK